MKKQKPEGNYLKSPPRVKSRREQLMQTVVLTKRAMFDTECKKFGSAKLRDDYFHEFYLKKLQKWSVSQLQDFIDRGTGYQKRVFINFILDRVRQRANSRNRKNELAALGMQALIYRRKDLDPMDFIQMDLFENLKKALVAKFDEPTDLEIIDHLTQGHSMTKIAELMGWEYNRLYRSVKRIESFSRLVFSKDR